MLPKPGAAASLQLSRANQASKFMFLKILPSLVSIYCPFSACFTDSSHSVLPSNTIVPFDASILGPLFFSIRSLPQSSFGYSPMTTTRVPVAHTSTHMSNRHCGQHVQSFGPPAWHFSSHSLTQNKVRIVLDSFLHSPFLSQETENPGNLKRPTLSHHLYSDAPSGPLALLCGQWLCLVCWLVRPLCRELFLAHNRPWVNFC